MKLTQDTVVDRLLDLSTLSFRNSRTGNKLYFKVEKATYESSTGSGTKEFVRILVGYREVARIWDKVAVQLTTSSPVYREHQQVLLWCWNRILDRRLPKYVTITGSFRKSSPLLTVKSSRREQTTSA